MLSLYPGVDSLCHKQLFELIMSLFFSEWHLALWNSHLVVTDEGPLILKTDRHHSVQR